MFEYCTKVISPGKSLNNEDRSKIEHKTSHTLTHWALEAVASSLGAERGAVVFFHTERIRIYISKKSEESKMFETITVGVIHKIYITYVAFNMKENQKQA